MIDLSVTSTNRELKQFYIELNTLLAERGMQLLPETLEVRWSDKMSNRRVGACYAKKRSDGSLLPTKIVLNINYFRRKEGPSSLEIEGTLRHEAAHVWTAAHCGRLDHSKAWQHVAKILGNTGQQYTGASLEEIVMAACGARDVPTTLDAMSKRDIHAIRTSMKHICRKKNIPVSRESFNKYVRIRFPHFSEDSIKSALDILLKGNSSDTPPAVQGRD